ncbi:MAG: hypothetical protein J6Z49_07315, partial [Kiritimatiellae bacterium]|nr:hypothetical protein [Kiritimatiellia bacterium]
NGGTIRITGGTVTARGTGWGAGIGGGDGGNGGTVSISGGVVTAIGGASDGGAGIGGGWNAYAAEVTVSGGTVVAQAGSGYVTDVGSGAYQSSGVGSFHVTGGSLRLVNGRYDLAPSNATDRVWCVTVSGLVANTPVTLDGLAGYGQDDLYADTDGCIYLWLPNGEYAFQANGNDCAVTVDGGNATPEVVVNVQSLAITDFTLSNTDVSLTLEADKHAAYWLGALRILSAEDLGFAPCETNVPTLRSSEGIQATVTLPRIPSAPKLFYRAILQQ